MQRDLNPFFHRGPIREPAFFFGRRDALAFLVEMLQQGQSVAIHGQRRFGKTSLLFQLARPEVAADYGFDRGATDWAYIDGGMLDDLDETWLWGAIGQAQGGNEDAIAYPRLVEHLRALQRQGRRVVVALDEFELVASNPLLGLSVFNRLRSLAAQLPVQFVTASKRPLFDLTFAHVDTLSSPFFNIFAPWQLGLLGDADADALLATLSERGGRPFVVETRAFLHALVGPHPLFLQIAGYHAFAALQGANGE
ncbi:MAG TPA: hypothetical protein VFT99_00600, partial [Roseiflexaceae bacterium]|nr:hypothetical protein [Roseiflexaceae bacterium]